MCDRGLTKQFSDDRLEKRAYFCLSAVPAPKRCRSAECVRARCLDLVEKKSSTYPLPMTDPVEIGFFFGLYACLQLSKAILNLDRACEKCD